MSQSERQAPSTYPIDRGLYVLRYVSSPARLPPVAAIRIVRGSIGLLQAPGRARAELARPGQSLIVLARSAGSLEIDVRPATPGEAPAAHFTLDLLDRGDPAEDAGADVARAGTADDAPFEIEAHLGRLGAVRVRAGAWIAGPDRPLPIEGLTIVGAKAAGLLVQVQSVQQPGRWSRWYEPGRLAGTRGQSVPLAGIRLRLDRPEGRTIVGEAMFLGQAPVKREGSQIEFSAYDPLVGLKVDLAAAAEERADPVSEPPGPVRVPGADA